MNEIHVLSVGCRVLEDYAVICFGSAIFKVTRLLFIAMLSVHLFACVFYRIKEEFASDPADVSSFYETKNVNPSVSSDFVSKPSVGLKNLLS